MDPDFQIFKRSIVHAIADWPVTLSEQLLDKLWMHFGAVIECNRQFNLTRITDPQQAAIKHFADSMALIAWANTIGIELSTLLDIGTGAGFPAIPIAVMQPNIEVVAIESTAKKASFVARTAKLMSLKNLQVEHAHSSHWKSTATFQIVTGRAVANTATCIQNFSEYVPSGGYCVLYKTADLREDEISEGHDAARRAGFTACKPFFYELQQSENSPRILDISSEPRTLASSDSPEATTSKSDIKPETLRRQLVIFQR